MKLSPNKLRINFRMLSMVLILVVMWIFFRLEVGGFYFSGESIAKLSRDMVSWTVLAGGMTLIIISGNIDLSVGSLLALVAASCALMMNTDFGLGLPGAIAIPIALAIGTLLGTFQGILTAYFRIPSFIVTLGGLFVFRGITQEVSAFDPRIPDTSWVTSLGFKFLAPTLGLILGIISVAVIVLFLIRGKIKKSKLGLPADSAASIVVKSLLAIVIIVGLVLKVNQYRGIPYQTLIMIAVFLGLYVVARYTRLGRRLYAIGGNTQAARLSGIKVEKNIVASFAIMGFLTGIAGVIWMAQNQGATKNAGEFYELYAIAAVVIGGTSLMGGRGTILGTFLGGLVMATVIQGMDYTSLENWIQLVVRGAVLVIAVGIDIAAKDPPLWMQKMKQKFRFNL
jgi:D-xylose transport system permease protein